jgi:hypothetical protein
MASVIKIKRSTTPGSAPSSLAAGEIAVNIPDRQLFVGDGSSIYRIGAQYITVANAAATYATKAYAAANSYVKSTLANTNAYIATKISNNVTTTLQTQAIIPAADVTYDLGSSTRRFKTLWISGSTINLGAASLTATGSSLAVGGEVLVSNTYLRTTYVANTRFQSVLANTNAYIATKVNVTNPSTSGLLAHTGRATISTNLAVSGNTSVAGNLLVDGNLTVEGAVTYISSSTLNVDDSMIKLAANNAGDTVDVGFYGKYVSTGTKYSGLFRDASDGIFKFYTGSQSEPSTTVDTGATGYTVATIEAVVDGGTY